MRTFMQTALAATAAMLLAPGLAAAQEAPAPQQKQPGAGAPSAEMQSLVKEYRQVAQKLQKIREGAIEANPELEEKRKSFQSKVKTAMADNGYDVEASRERVQELGSKLKGGDVEQGDKQALIQELRAEQQEMREAQQAAMQKPEIQAAGQELQQATVTAMREQDSETDKLLDRMTELRGKLQAMQAGGGGNRGGGGAPPSPGN